MAILFDKLGSVKALPTRVKIQLKKDIIKRKRNELVKQPTFPSNAFASKGHCGGGTVMRFNSTSFNLLKKRRKAMNSRRQKED
jgi:hypothetical protein